ncbi:DNA-binding response regulator, OmpR family, contains REC and winged-helix (wHTH) domain [Streptoalloteichus tenebrarius]|uniref:DNA-binding response regulator, OmpR family, contains REC and winged-helix (WHTH) domain n=1 Tax=Streptoalloteichus tenebrarius (strain ATCC 17920 / DSM 40477 / JCM 4838 / CBS 697.72 / NBRC 16177 / NCIMB 11028 / NRRL B-12390 / A12253. 1 / ISP 5477) TaxID=1933 RepID=A0ABT1HXR4_STRSD|nr:two-component system response regulator CseB [Streptoalloteichus tenebrarius]MCP2260322.1 DNA-binding response regulator, OmpR family, contains REC and winged-helix (wHTH) domain [Streptoalloteichus tenebrarius]BFF03072.1 two-component system response regulator CseB [Streptoalloteichus tenebrarius]
MTPEPATEVLLVEDDAVIREATQLALERYGFRVRTAPDGLVGLESFTSAPPDIAVLDIMLPHLDGISLCRRIRDASAVPVLLLSARSDPLDVVQGLEAGADDYVTKPFDTQVLVARIRAVLRRSGVEPVTGPAGVEVFGDLEIDRAAMEVRRGGELLSLTPTESRLLLEFAAEPGIVLSRDTLLRRVWDYPAGGDTRVVDVHVQRLRAKIGKERIETVRGFGYKLRR